MDFPTLTNLLDNAIASRRTFVDPGHEMPFRLFNGFSEGFPELTLEVYGHTLVVHNYADDPNANRQLILNIIDHIGNALPWLNAGVIKFRKGKTKQEKNGFLVFGNQPDTQVKEIGVWYAVNLTLNRDASIYIDTRNVRQWLMNNMHGKSVLNTFAYTGSLGTAAIAGGAKLTIQTDRNHQFLKLAKESYRLNSYPIREKDFIVGNFFPTIARLKHAKQFFDCVILDPPFFSTTNRGTVDQETDSVRLINKVRPLINDGGYLIAINNALYLSGREYMESLEHLCKDGYMKINTIIPIPEDCTGYKRVETPITDPAPFNHSTKIVILDIRRKNNS